ncbi:MAG: cyclic nucleotide-binding domain-containing protein [Anaerolineae bacterium]
MENILARLRKVPLFSSLSDDDLEKVGQIVSQEHRRPEEIIIQQGEMGTTFYVIDSGQLKVTHTDAEGRSELLNYLGPGQFFGEAALLTGELRNATVETVQETDLFAIDKEDFDRLLEEHPPLKEELNIEASIRQKLGASRFLGRQKNEVIVSFQRKHPYALVRRLVLPGLITLAFLGALVLGFSFGFRSVLLLVLGAIGALALGGWTAWIVVDWYNDYYIVTNQRVIHIEKVAFIFEERREAPLDRIQSVNVITPGPLAQLLDFDNLIIETAGATGRVIFTCVSRGESLRRKIYEQIIYARARERLREREEMARSLRQALRQSSGQALRQNSGQALRQVSGQALGYEEPSQPVTTEMEGEEMPAPAQTLKAAADLLATAWHSFWPQMRLVEGSKITWRKHWYVLFTQVRRPLIVAFILLVALVVLIGEWAGRWHFGLGRTVLYGAFPVGVLLIGAVGWLWWLYEDWRNDVYILTDEAIFDVERTPLFLHEESRQASLGQVQDITYTIPHPMAKVFGFGNVHIETAARVGKFTFDSVADPQEVQREIYERIMLFRERQRQQEADRRKAEFVEWLGLYHEITNAHRGEEGESSN